MEVAKISAKLHIKGLKLQKSRKSCKIKEKVARLMASCKNIVKVANKKVKLQKYRETCKNKGKVAKITRNS